jgi:hypothetical protein
MSDLQPATANETTEEKNRKRREPGSGCLVLRVLASLGIGAHRLLMLTAERSVAAE